MCVIVCVVCVVCVSKWMGCCVHECVCECGCACISVGYLKGLSGYRLVGSGGGEGRYEKGGDTRTRLGDKLQTALQLPAADSSNQQRSDDLGDW